MATEVASMPNGTYASHQGSYGGVEQNNYAYSTNASTSQQAAAQAPPPSTTPSNGQAPAQPEISKDEVGWYFVEQYYTTLSRSPEKLYLFYNKRSQFVSGQETDKVAVCVGQRAINDKIKDLDFQDCKVRVTNVDSQASDQNIVIQVIGELSNKGQPHRKFTQTFVLATQTNGYFVLNDIFRYLVDEEEEPETEAVAAPAQEDIRQAPDTESGYQEPPPTEVEPKPSTSSDNAAAVEHDAADVEKELDEKLGSQEETEDVPALAVNGESAGNVEKEEFAEAEQPVSISAAEAEQSTEEVDEDIQPEKLKDPEPAPAATPTQEATPTPAQATKPAAPSAPMSWASRAAAANRVATPQTAVQVQGRPTPVAKTSTVPVPASATSPSAPSISAQAATPSAPSAPSAPAAQRQEPQSSDSQDEWTAVGPSHNRQQSRQANPQPEGPQFRGYIKNVQDNVNEDELKAKLEQFGEIIYFDVARQKNCAFVDFKTAEGYQRATAEPFQIGDDKLFVEERRIRPGSTPYIPRGQFQGGRGNRGGAGGQGAPRGNFQGNRGTGNGRGRGGFPAGQRGGRGGAA